MTPVLVAINSLHAFREGNGRAQRLFVKQLARELGIPLEFKCITKERMISASVAAHDGGPSMMHRLMIEASDPERTRMLVEAIDHARANDVNIDDMYVATSTAGQSYRGRIAGNNGSNVILSVRHPTPQVIVGDVRDADFALDEEMDVTLNALRY